MSHWSVSQTRSVLKQSCQLGIHLSLVFENQTLDFMLGQMKKSMLLEMVRYFEIKKACVPYDPNILKYADLISISHLFLFLSE